MCVCVCVCVCLTECDLETATVRRPRAEMGYCPHKTEKYIFRTRAIDALLEKVLFYLHGKACRLFHKVGSESQA